jgi:hypothetical protein
LAIVRHAPSCPLLLERIKSRWPLTAGGLPERPAPVIFPARAGASIKAVQKMLGHKSATLTLDRYGHLYGDELQGVADQLDLLHAAASEKRAQSVPTRLRVVR